MEYVRPNRSDVHLSGEEAAKIEAAVRERFDEAAPKRHTKPQRSDHSAVYTDALSSDDGVIAEHAQFQQLEKDTEKLVNSGSKPDEEFTETEYYKDLNCVDKQHHTTGTGFIKMENTNEKDYSIAGEATTECHASSKWNPVTNDWIPSPSAEVDFTSDKPLGNYHVFLSYEASLRVCLHCMKRGSKEAAEFLDNGCALLLEAFGLNNIILKSKEEMMENDPSVEGAFGKACDFWKTSKRRIEVRVREVKMGVEQPTGCIAHVISGSNRYLREVPVLVTEPYSCLLRLKSSPEMDSLRMQPGSGEARVFLLDGFGDGLIIVVQDSKGKYCGHAFAQVDHIADESGEKLCQCVIYREPEHKRVGKIQIDISYSATADENSYECTTEAKTIAYDCVLGTAMKVQQFQQRNLLLHGSWKWLVKEFASYFGVSDAYTKLRYLSYVMDVATPTADCLDLVHDLLLSVIKDKSNHSLSHQEVRLLGEVSDQIEQILTLVFENYKSLDESLPSGIKNTFEPATGVAAAALAPALLLYEMLHNILSPEVRLKLCRYFQNATRKRSWRHLSETHEFFSSNSENILLDPMPISIAYKKMVTLCLNIRNEILTDIQIHKQKILPSFIDLPNLSSSIYSTELYSRLQEFLVFCSPSGPSPPVAELVVAAADFQRDLSLWNICYIEGGVDTKDLFHLYITMWIQDKRLALLELCNLDRAKSSSFSTTPFIDDIYGRLKETLTEYDVIIRRLPDFSLALEIAIADVVTAAMGTLERHYIDVLSPLKENAINKRFALICVQKLAKGNLPPYIITAELGVFLNSMKSMLDNLCPQMEAQLKQWGSCMLETGNMVPGEKLSDVTVMIRSKFRAYVQAIGDKLVENTKLHNVTKLKKIIEDAKENVIDSDLRQRMQPLKELLTKTVTELHTVLETQVCVMVCRVFWDRMGQDVLKFLEGRKENMSSYKASRAAVNVLDEVFASQMHQLMGDPLPEDLEPPQCILELRSMLCIDVTHKRGNY